MWTTQCRPQSCPTLQSVPSQDKQSGNDYLKIAKHPKRVFYNYPLDPYIKFLSIAPLHMAISRMTCDACLNNKKGKDLCVELIKQLKPSVMAERLRAPNSSTGV